MNGLPPILTFHAIEDGPAPDSFPPDLFARGMARLHGEGYRTIELLDLVECLQTGAPFPERAFVLTFDDGYRSVYERAAPVLARYGWTATVFLVTGERRTGAGSDRLPEMSGRPMLSWREVDEMGKAGLSFGAHTLTHPDLTRLSPGRAEDEVAGSKASIEERLGAPVRAFAYPFGRYDATTREIVRRHFECACSDRLGLVSAGSDIHALERVDAHYLRRERLFAAIATRWFPLYVRTRAAPRRLRRAVLAGRVGR